MSDSQNSESESISFRDFLEREAVGADRQIRDLTARALPLVGSSSLPAVVFATPQIKLYCRICEAVLNFSAGFFSSPPKVEAASQLIFLTYWCNNCRRTKKDFALKVQGDPKTPGPGEALKIGEHPISSEKLPNRLLHLVEEDRELFLKGWRAEREKLGLGAFSYYRRVVENQKSTILSAIANAAESAGDPSLAREIREANEETQFSSAVDRIKHALPDRMLVGGHNPLKVLHKALSDGLHNKDDAHCLEYAETIRVVLSALAERIAELTKDETQLRVQIGKLLSARD